MTDRIDSDQEKTPANNVKTFTKPKKLTPEEDDAEASAECLSKGIEAFERELEEATGFLAITFDNDQVPRIIWAGAIDAVYSMGALEIAKYELFNTIVNS